MSTVSPHARWDDGTEASALDLDPRIHLATDASNLRPNVLALSIAVGPDHEHVRSSSFLLKVPLNALLVLRDVRRMIEVDDAPRRQ